MRIYFILGRVFFGIPLILFGISHFKNHAETIAYVPSYLPAPEFIIYFTGIALILSGLSIIFGIFAQLATALLALMFVLFIALIYIPTSISDGYKDFFVLGGALILFYIFNKEAEC